jgi:hypothetical protein
MNTLNGFLFTQQLKIFYFHRRLDYSLQLPTLTMPVSFSSSSIILSTKVELPFINSLVLYVDTLDLFDIRSEFKKSIYDETGVLVNARSWNHYLTNRYGIGEGIVTFLESFCGHFPKGYVDLFYYNSFFYMYGFSGFFFKNKLFFDSDLAKIGNYTYSRHKERFTFKGWCHINGYPTNGQKRRSNYKTTRKMKYFSILRTTLN